MCETSPHRGFPIGSTLGWATIRSLRPMRKCCHIATLIIMTPPAKHHPRLTDPDAVLRVPSCSDSNQRFPSMPLDSWAGTKETLHRYLQIVGKIRLAVAPRRNHWWHIPFHLTARGLTTRPMGTDPVFAIDFDFIDHRLVVATGDGGLESFPLGGNSVATFYEQTMTAFGELGIAVVIERPEPFDLPDTTPFADDFDHHEYDPFRVSRYWRILSEVNLILEEFAGEFSGKTSPVHHFWHTMDIAVSRFSDREVLHPSSIDSVTREAYSREVISSGFWFGDPTFPEPAFYSYTSPEPPGVAAMELEPDHAEWIDKGNSHLAVYRYDDARATSDPSAAIMQFYESAYRAGASLAAWDNDRLASPSGTTVTTVTGQT